MFKRKFQSKNIVETITAGDCLRRKREESGLSIKEIGKRLGIKEDYLEDLENGNYQDLPPQVYVRGFIKSYSGLLGIDGSQLIRIYNREIAFMDEDSGKSKKAKPERARLGDYLFITPKILTLLASLLIFSVLGYYFYRQVDSFNSKPYLYVESPATDVVVTEKELMVKGKTEGDAVLRINGQDVSVGSDGIFSQKITLSEGRNLLIIEAINRFNKMDQKEINIVYENPIEEDKTITEIPPVDSDVAVSTDAAGAEAGVIIATEGNVAGAATAASGRDIPAAPVVTAADSVPAKDATASAVDKTAILDATGSVAAVPGAGENGQQIVD